ncbi:MAG: hypothetical protein D6719_10125 [Candidatus Dadabacteria bacterium]|nr:MAG: hypothetical protein D6719_10125 [Candidatus Dadabacteria bacterium]
MSYEFRKKFTLAVIIIIALALCYRAVLIYQSSVGRGSELSVVQYLFFVPVWVAVVYALWPVERILRLILLTVLCFAGLAGFIAFRIDVSGDSSFVVSRLSDDDLESSSRILRNRIRELTKVYGKVGISRYYDAIVSVKEANEFFKNNPETPAVVWGSKRWINITVRGVRSLRFDEFKLAGIKGKLPFFWINTVPAVGLSFKPELGTARYLAALFAALATPIEGSSLKELALREQNLKAAASLRETWTSFEHRGYALWLLGNQYVVEAFSQNPPEISGLDCGINSYIKAGKYLRVQDNPEFYAAIKNNLAISYYLKSVLTSQKGLLKLARENFLLAARAGWVTNPYKFKFVAPQIAAGNLKKLMRIKKKKRKENLAE